MMECQDVTKESYPGQAPAFGMGRLSRRIEAHTFLCFLALLLEWELARRLKP